MVYLELIIITTTPIRGGDVLIINTSPLIIIIIPNKRLKKYKEQLDLIKIAIK